MRSVAWTYCLSALIAVVSGCSPARTQLPTWEASNPRAEKQAFQVHDPLPDTTAGPETNARPRSFDIQRSEARRAKENVPPRIPLGPGYPAPTTGSIGSEYPNVVPH